jgi:hypothetical protein
MECQPYPSLPRKKAPQRGAAGLSGIKLVYFAP